MKDEKIYISLEVLATTLGLPHRYLKSLATKGYIPFLDVCGRLRFNLQDVQIAIRKLAEQGAADEL